MTWDEPSEWGHGLTGHVVRTRLPQVAHDIATDPGYAPWREAALQRGYASAITLPLPEDSRVIGTLNVCTGSEERL